MWIKACDEYCAMNIDVVTCPKCGGDIYVEDELYHTYLMVIAGALVEKCIRLYSWVFFWKIK